MASWYMAWYHVTSLSLLDPLLPPQQAEKRIKGWEEYLEGDA